MPPKLISDSELINLSIAMTVRQIADYTGLSPWTVRRRLKRIGIEPGTMNQAANKQRYSDEELVALGHFYSLTAMAVITGYSYQKIMRLMKDITISRRHLLDKNKIERMIKDIQFHLDPPKTNTKISVGLKMQSDHDIFDPIDCETIVHMRDRQGKSFGEIAEAFGCNEDLVERAYSPEHAASQD